MIQISREMARRLIKDAEACSVHFYAGPRAGKAESDARKLERLIAKEERDDG